MKTLNADQRCEKSDDEVVRQISDTMKKFGLRATAKITFCGNQPRTRIWSFYKENGRSLCRPCDDAEAIRSLFRVEHYDRRRKNRILARTLNQMAEDKNQFLASKWFSDGKGSYVRRWWFANLQSDEAGLLDDDALAWLTKRK